MVMNGAALILGQPSRQTIPLLRAAAPVQDARGVFQAQPPVESSIICVVQELSGEDLERVPEADRNRSVIQIYAVEELRITRGSFDADRVIWEGETYRVVKVENWSMHGRVWLAYAELEDPAPTGAT